MPLFTTVDYDNRAVERRLFTAIVSMCSARILSRLRFKSKRSKQPFRTVLGEAIDSLSRLVPQSLHKSPIKLFVERSKDLMRLSDSWNHHQTQAEMENMVEGVYRLKQTEGFPALLDAIPNREMSPSSRRNLINIVKKVSRYREAARFLYRMSRRTPLLRRANIVLVDLPEGAYDRVTGKQPSTLASSIARVSTKRCALNIDYLSSLLGLKASELTEQFTNQTRKSLSEAKVHAEIQLVLYYELNASRMPPRVVCSSKDACFLCNEFILIHGKMHTPRCHGRLYPGWRLPSISNTSDLHLRFNAVLEDRIKESLQTLRSRKKKTTYPDPNESTLLTLQVSTSTMRTTSALIEATSRKEVSATIPLVDAIVPLGQNSRPDEDQVKAPISKDTDCDVPVLGSKRSIIAKGDEPSETPVMGDPTTASIREQDPPMTSRSKETPDTETLVQDIPQADRISTHDPRFHTTGSLEIHMECAAEAAVSDTDRGQSDIAYSIEWLSVDRAKELAHDRATTVLDVEALQCETSRAVEYQDEILIMGRGHVVRISSQR